MHPKILASIDPSRPYTYRSRITMTGTTTDGTEKIIIDPGSDFIVTQGVIVGYYTSGGKAKAIIESDATRDYASVSIKRPGGQDMQNESVDIFAWNKQFERPDHQGWYLQRRSELVFTISNTANTLTNYALPMHFDILLFGYFTIKNLT